MPATQSKKRGHFQLNTDDMDRYKVDLRRDLDREKRRFQAAKMIDEFELQLRKVLKDLNGQGDGPADTNGGDNNQQPSNPENQIKITVIDKENSNRLLNFLKYIIETCQRIDQQELMQEVLRQALQDTRRKRFKTQQEAPGAPMEPFCLFCACDLNGALVTNCRDESHRQQSFNMRPALTDVSRSASMPRVELVQMTPPPSAMPTPEVGDQSGIYTPNIQATTIPRNAQNNATPSPTLGRANALVHQPTGFKDGLLTMKTNASEAASNVRTKAQLPSASPGPSDIVGPSEDGSSSDNEPTSLQDVTEWANHSRGHPNEPGSSEGRTGRDDNELAAGERRCSTPLGDDPERTMPQLVIDESSQGSHGIASPIYRPGMKAAPSNVSSPSKSIKPTIKGGKAIATSVVPPVSSPRPVNMKPHLSQPLRSDANATRPTETSAANLSKFEQSSTNSQQLSGPTRTKYCPKRRNRNN